MGKYKNETGKTRVGMFLKKYGKTIGKGVLKVADNTLIGGLVHNIIEEVETPKGKVSGNLLSRTLLSSTIPVAILLLLAFKIITFDQVKELLLLFGLAL